MDGWWSEIDRDVRAILERSGPTSPRDIARQLRLSEGAIAFDTTIVVAPQATEAAPAKFTELIFHELVHVVQYRLLGVDRFAQLYVDGWMAGRARFRDDPAQRYMNILLEHMAFQLQGRYV